MPAPRGRAVSLTRRGWSLTGAALGLVIGSFLLGTLEMLVLGVAALALVATAAIWLAIRDVPQLTVTRRVLPARLHVGSEGRVDLLVENRGARSTPLLTATDLFDSGRRAARFLIPPLARGGTARAAYRVPTRRRGRYQVGPLIVTAGDPFGVARRAGPGIGHAEVIVRPRIHQIVAPVAVGGRIVAGDEDAGVQSIASDLGHEFLTLR
ncbi:MAG TPA: CARDB domain-containing protein, partial [Acidimicrobiia bacterium]